MAKRRHFLGAIAGLPVGALFAAAGTKLPNSTMDEAQARVTREKFGDLRIYYQGSTDQVKSMTAGGDEPASAARA
jgi:hypothetical protein